MKKFFVLDFESAWDSQNYSLERMGPLEYVRDDRFHALCMGFTAHDGSIQVAEYDDIPDALASLCLGDPNTWTVGHNINGFDALILSEIYGIHPANILDTQILAKWCGIDLFAGGASHKKLTAFFNNGVKKEGVNVSDGKFRKEDFSPAEWEFFKGYCADDVRQCRDNLLSMLGAIPIPKDVPKFCSLSARMATEPGFVVDRQKISAAIEHGDERVERARKEIYQHIHKNIMAFASNEAFLKAIRSDDSFAAMLRELGVAPPTKQVKQGKTIYAFAKTDAEFLELKQHPHVAVQRLVTARLEFNSNALSSRAENILSLTRKKTTLPIILKPFGTITGRYAAGNVDGESDGINMQNMGKNTLAVTLRQGIVSPKGMRVVACDLCQIEARMLAYLANQRRLLRAFQLGECPYCQLAEKIWGVPAQQIQQGVDEGNPMMTKQRAVAKLAVLSAGYGIGRERFGKDLWLKGAHLAPTFDAHMQKAVHVHRVYREENPEIVRFWNDCDDILNAMTIDSESYDSFGGPDNNMITFGNIPLGALSVEGKYLTTPGFKFPSHFVLRLKNLRVEGTNSDPVFMYDKRNAKGAWVPEKIYGAKLASLLCQTAAFQIVMWHMCRLQEQGVIVKANVHDDLIAVVPEEQVDDTADIMRDVMTQAPSWLPGFPLDCKVKIGADYSVA